MSERTSPRAAGEVRLARGVPRLTRWVRGQRGSALVAVVAIIAAVLLIGSALFILGTSEAGVVEYTVDSERALWLAEAGLERAQTWLGKSYEDDPGFNPVDTEISGQLLGDGEYGFRVEDVVPSPSGLPAYSVVSTGEKDGAVRQVRVIFEAESLARYQWFISNQAPDTWMVTGDVFEGPVHHNGHLRIDGDPWFGARVTAAGDYIEKPNSNPTFTAGYEVNVAPIELPDYDAVNEALRLEAIDHGLYLDGTGGVDYYEVEFARGGQLGYLSYRSYSGSGYSPWETRGIDELGGAAWFEEEVRIKGMIDGELTLGCAEDIYIDGDVLFEDSSPGSGPNPECDDLFGIVGMKEVVIADTAENNPDCEVHGVIMALGRSMMVENWNNPPPRGTLTLWGGVIVDQAWRINTWVGDIIRSGYIRDWHYDGRLGGLFPPYFPTTGGFLLISWEEVVPPVTS